MRFESYLKHFNPLNLSKFCIKIHLTENIARICYKRQSVNAEWGNIWYFM
jgi:hypothetical protein